MARARRLLASALATAGLAAAPAPLALGGGHVLVPTATVMDDQGRTHLRLQHRYLGLRVWGSETLLHPDDPGRPGLGALALPGPAGPGPAPLDLDLLPGIAPEAALEAVRTDLGPDGLSAQLTLLETVIYPRMVDYPAAPPGVIANAVQMLRFPAGYALAYRIRAEPLDGTPDSAAREVLLDAHTGAILLRLPLEQAATAARAVGRTLYSDTRMLDVTEQDGEYRLADPTRPDPGRLGAYGGNAVVDMRGSPSPPTQLVGRTRRTWGDGQPAPALEPRDTDTYDTVAADAAFGLQNAWDYFRRIHGRNGYDGLGTAVTVRVHPFAAFDNAFWNGDYIQVNEGLRYWPRATPRALAHEFAHAVTGSTARLAYTGEPGGLNEATSDIFAAMAVAWLGNGSGRVIGDAGTVWTVDRWRASSTGAPERLLDRSMVRPSLNGASPDVWSEDLGAREVHEGSGPMDRAFYFLSQGASAEPGDAAHSDDLPEGMAGIGNDKAARIWYDALTTGLTATSTYRDARTAALRSAVKLYGSGSAENIAVHKAFAAIRVGRVDARLDDFEPPTVTAACTLDGSRLVLAAEARDNDRVASVTFLVDGVPVATRTAEPWSATLDSARLLANGDHALTALALDPSGNQGAAAPVPFRLANPYQQLLRDPGLETPAGTGAWTQPRSALLQPVLPVRGDSPGLAPHGGRSYALFSQNTQTILQSVTVPAGVASATLGFWVQGNADPGGPDGEALLVSLASDDFTDPLPRVRLRLAAREAWGDWVRCELDATAFAGRRVQVAFTAALGPASATRFRLDDVTLVCGQAPVRVRVDPAVLALPAGASSGPVAATVTGTTTTGVAWSVREAGGGSLDAGGRYTAPARPGFYHLVATALADPLATAEVSVQVLPAIRVIPAAAAVTINGTVTLALQLAPGVGELELAFREGAGAGSAVADRGSGTVAWTAPATPGTYHLVIRDGADPTRQASVALTALPDIRVSFDPPALTLATYASTVLNAGASDGSGLTFAIAEGDAGGHLSTASAGPDDARPSYQSPLFPGVYHVVATSTLNPACRATLTVTAVEGLALDPPELVLTPGASRTLTASLSGTRGAPADLAWTGEPAGALVAAGGSATYTAPGGPGTYTVTAATTQAPVHTATVTIRVVAADPDGDGRAGRDFGDLAAMADAYGSTGQALAADLTGDGRVDDDDLAEALAAFERSGPAPAAAPAGARRPPGP